MNRDNAFNKVAAHAVKNFMDSQDEKNKTAQLRMTLALIAVLAFVGMEAVKILFRKNFGFNGINLIRLILCFLCFTGIGLISFNQVDSTDNFATSSGTPDSHFASGIFYLILACTVLGKGIADKIKAVRNNLPFDYDGDSSLLGVLAKDGWSRYKIQHLAEPLLTLVTGTAICFFDRLAGIPIIFCAISVWGYQLFEVLFPERSLHQTITRLNNQSAPSENFKEIINDNNQ